MPSTWAVAPIHSCRHDPGNERLCLRGADPNGLRLVTCPLVADEDVVVARRQRRPGLVAYGDVLIAGIVEEALRPMTVSRPPSVSLLSASTPLAVSSKPVMLLKSAAPPLAVLAVPVVLKKSA